MHCTENDEINNELDGKDVIDLRSENQTTTSELHDGEESTKQESQDTVKSKTITKLESKNRPEKDNQVAETEEIEVAMMCWENIEDSPGKEPCKETENKEEKPDKDMQNQNMKKNMLTLHYIQATD